ncbi:SDR family NAD(P)-dependent oxidoreductase [Klenkia terrae]|jgi:NAD(P)-dependent dehydrogenase (short-subunit alcohol dehydrogenase family)|uniref:SDR family NAD(P)-dependent oxidoreductase n=1 Tax=Klenkia terrae TaxID=1052259 RepID=A0ABU8EBM9_9ACTN|nr:SDR family NAD(P)-dependent oxidoreductase [Klenkia terrae]SSC25541.1 Short-chain dehydrogenase/reductase SDR [Klenkia terrae]
MDLQLSGKRALVTGAGRGIGKAVAVRLAQEGARVALLARSREDLEAVAAELPGESLVVPADTTDDAAVRAAVAAVVQAWGGVDVLVNAAARPASTAPVPALADLPDDALRDEVETKVLGYLRTARAAAPHMVAQGWGRIVNVSGLNARATGNLVGTVRNVAVAAMTANLAEELGPSGVNVTVVHPGRTVTERTPADVAAAPAATRIGRLVTAAEVADVVAFLCSPRSVAITGDAVAVGGGTPGVAVY